MRFGDGRLGAIGHGISHVRAALGILCRLVLPRVRIVDFFPWRDTANSGIDGKSKKRLPFHSLLLEHAAEMTDCVLEPEQSLRSNKIPVLRGFLDTGPVGLAGGRLAAN
jgi:hypothetical protein